MRYLPARQEVVLKVVYYGPGLAGKTTNLQFLQARVPSGRASQLVSLDTHSERTLQFDFLAIELGKVQGFDVRLDFYTVPGQSYYAATRRQVVAGADGVVFVADSRREALDENIDAMNELLGNLRHHGLPEDLPLVIQYNKQDLPTALTPQQIHPLMNVRNWPSFGASAIAGQGVSETCEALARMLAERLAVTTLPQAVPTTDLAVHGGEDLAQPRSWLITCCRCQSMLDVPSARIGETYTCGVCQSQLEVVDPERGTTRFPAAAPRPVTGMHQRPGTGGISRTRGSASLNQDPYGTSDLGSGGYATTALGSGGYATTALRPPTAVHGRPGYIAPAGEFPLDGFTVLGTQDENPQGRRLRVREQATGKTFRALVLSPALLAQPGYAEGVESYARMTGPIRHPNLLPLASFRVAPEAIVFLSGDPADHEPLAHVLARRRALAPPHAIGILRQVALALEEASRHGAIHGWLRPDVILVSADGSVKLDEICIPPSPRYLLRELAGVSAGTEYYLAPEYLDDGVRGDIRGDIFLLGALLFRMLTGEGLVTGYNAIEALHKLAANGPRPLRDVQQGISRELNAFYLKLAAVDRGERFQTYRELIDAIDRFGGGARRQNLQLTGMQSRPPGMPNGATGTTSGRRGGTQPLPPAPRARREPSGGQPILPPPSRRQSHQTGPFFVAVTVIVVLVAGLCAVILFQSRPKPVAVEDPVKHEMPPPMPPKPEPAAPSAVAKPEPAPAASPAVVQDAAKERLELRRTLADQLVAEQFAAALKTSDRFTDPVDLRESQALVLERHDARKRDIEAMLKPGVSADVIRKLLVPARNTWGLPGDLEWAVAVQSRADAIALAEPLPTSPAVVPVATETASVPVPTVPAVKGEDWGPSKPAPLVPMLDAKGQPIVAQAAQAAVPVVKRDLAPATDGNSAAYGSVVKALLANQPTQAQNALNSLPAGSPEQLALRQLVSWWPARVDLVNRVAGSKVIHLRFPHPTTNEQVDVVSADDAGMSVSSSTGSTSTIAWAQIPNQVLSKVFADAAGVAGNTGEEIGGAVAAQFVLDQPDMGMIIAKRGKGLLGEHFSKVEILHDLGLRRRVLAQINQGFDAARSGDYPAAAAALAEVRKLDKDALAGLEAEVARLATAATEPPPPPTVPTAGQILAPTLPKDLKDKQAALRTLGWEPLGDAWLDGVEVQIMPNAGIAFELGRGIGGFIFTAHGEGYLRLIPSRGTAGATGKTGIPLPLVAGHENSYTVNLTHDTLAVLDAKGTLIQSLPLAAPPTTFLIVSTGEATLSTVPKPIIP
jgi:mutual gliding-motility protein MglA